MKISTLVFYSLMSMGFHAFAEGLGADVVIGEIGYGGTACPNGSIKLEPSSSRINEIKFKNFKLSARKMNDRKACNIGVPLEVPAGVQVGIGAIDEISGTQKLPSSEAVLTVNQEVFFASARGKVIPFVSKGVASGKLKIVNSNLLKDLRWSECGESVTLRVNLVAQLANPTSKKASISLDSLKLLKNGKLYWRQCTK